MRVVRWLKGEARTVETRKQTTANVQNLYREGISSKKQCVDNMEQERSQIVDKIRETYGITTEEWKQAQELGRRAVTDYRQERAKEVVHCAGLPCQLLEYIQGQILKIEVENFVSITQAWRASPATMEWCIGTLLNEEGNRLDDCMVFECNLVISKFWIRILGREVYEAIINHELAHLEQNHVNLEQHILKTLCKLKNKQPGVTLAEKWRRYKVLREYLLWLEYNADQKASLSADAALKMYSFLSSAWLSFELFDTGIHPATRKRKQVVEEALFRAEAEEWLEKRKICRKCPDFQNCQTDRSSEKLRE